MSDDTNTSALDEFLRTDARDDGCERAIEILHVYAELMAGDPEEARYRYPGLAAHLRACGPCAEDLIGLLGHSGPHRVSVERRPPR